MRGGYKHVHEPARIQSDLAGVRPSRLGNTVGYHRLLTHRAFKATPPVRWLFTILGAALRSPMLWVGFTAFITRDPTRMRTRTAPRKASGSDRVADRYCPSALHPSPQRLRSQWMILLMTCDAYWTEPTDLA